MNGSSWPTGEKCKEFFPDFFQQWQSASRVACTNLPQMYQAEASRNEQGEFPKPVNTGTGNSPCTLCGPMSVAVNHCLFLCFGPSLVTDCNR